MLNNPGYIKVISGSAGYLGQYLRPGFNPKDDRGYRICCNSNCVYFIINLHVQNTCQLLHGITNMELIKFL